MPYFKSDLLYFTGVTCNALHECVLIDGRSSGGFRRSSGVSQKRQDDSDGFDQLGRRLREERHAWRLHACHKLHKLDLQQDESQLRRLPTAFTQHTETVRYGQ